MPSGPWKRGTGYWDGATMQPGSGQNSPRTKAKTKNKIGESLDAQEIREAAAPSELYDDFGYPSLVPQCISFPATDVPAAGSYYNGSKITSGRSSPVPIDANGYSIFGTNLSVLQDRLMSLEQTQKDTLARIEHQQQQQQQASFPASLPLRSLLQEGIESLQKVQKEGLASLEEAQKEALARLERSQELFLKSKTSSPPAQNMLKKLPADGKLSPAASDVGDAPAMGIFGRCPGSEAIAGKNKGAPRQNPKAVQDEYDRISTGEDQDGRHMTVGGTEVIEVVQEERAGKAQELVSPLSATNIVQFRAVTPFSVSKPSHSSSDVGAQRTQFASAGKANRLLEEPGLDEVLFQMADGMDISAAAGQLKSRGLRALGSSVRWCESRKEPRRGGYVAGIVASTYFSSFFMSIIVFDALFTWYVTDYKIRNMTEYASANQKFVEVIFMVLYVIEIGMKLVVHRQYYFWCDDYRWNVFEFTIVVYSLFDIFDLTVTLTFLRSLRMLKVGRILRGLKAMRWLTDLRVMVDCVMGCFGALFWCVVLIVIFLFLFGIVFVQSMTTYLIDAQDELRETAAGELRMEQSVDRFGSVGSAVISLAMAVTGGDDWKVFYELLQPCGWLPSCTFLFFVAFFVVAAWNIVTSLFIEKAMIAAKPSMRDMQIERHKQDKADVNELVQVFKRMDKSHADYITKEEVIDFVHDPKFMESMAVRGLDIKDPDLFF